MRNIHLARTPRLTGVTVKDGKVTTKPKRVAGKPRRVLEAKAKRQERQWRARVEKFFKG